MTDFIAALAGAIPHAKPAEAGTLDVRWRWIRAASL
jgi:hypothetical protein